MSEALLQSPLISVIELQKLMNDASSDLVIIDARANLMDKEYGQQAYRVSRIPNARRIDLGNELCAEITEFTGRHPLKTEKELEALMQKKGINQSSHIVIYDDKSSMFAIHLWWILKHLGHTNVQVLDGGLAAWVNADGLMETAVVNDASTKGDFIIRESEFNTVSADDIMHFLDNPSDNLCIIDARGPQRYRGETEPLDPVAGHIPTALNRPFEDNLTEEGRFKSKEILRDEFLLLLKDHQDAQFVHQCGSGISGCHNLFAMYYAGLGATILYPGSWSEWCKDPNRPVALGE